jgi:hypothetical protein
MTDLSDMPWAAPCDEGETYTPPAHGWTCFHCGETFHGQQAARLHFGASVNDEPKCQISANRLRAMEAELRRYRDEDTDLHREIGRIQSDHAIALRREEEKGYARGLEDAKKYPETLGLARVTSPTNGNPS